MGYSFRIGPACEPPSSCFWPSPRPAAAAEPANPELTALVRGVDDEENRRDTLRIETMDIEVRIHGGIAETIVTARFANPGEENLEAVSGSPCRAGSIVTGYALDVDGDDDRGRPRRPARGPAGL